MRAPLFFTLLIAAFTLQSCAKEAQDLGIVPNTCGTDGARLQASFNGSSFCPTAQLIAVGDSSSVIVTGVDLTGNTLIIQLDTLAAGDHPMTEASNGVLYMHIGKSFTIAPGSTGSLNISSFDAQTRRIKATFQAPLFNEESGETRQLQGELDVTYSMGG